MGVSTSSTGGEGDNGGFRQAQPADEGIMGGGRQAQPAD